MPLPSTFPVLYLQGTVTGGFRAVVMILYKYMRLVNIGGQKREKWFISFCKALLQHKTLHQTLTEM